MLLKTISLVLTSVLFLNSCGNSRWSEAKVAALPSVNVGLPTKSKGAYHKPLKLSNRSQSAANNAAFSTGNAGGFIGAAVGTAIISGIIIADQKRFESNSAAQISCIESLIDHRLEDSYAIQLIKSLKQQPFF
jgi:hypothetical protein